MVEAEAGVLCVGQGTPRTAGGLRKLGGRHGSASPLELPEGTNPASIVILDLLASSK